MTVLKCSCHSPPPNTQRHAALGPALVLAHTALTPFTALDPLGSAAATFHVLTASRSSPTTCLAWGSAGIVDKPADLDVATVLAMGFPPYRGGLIFWGDLVGAGAVGTNEHGQRRHGRNEPGSCAW